MGFAHRSPDYEGQQKWNVRAKMKAFLNTGNLAVGPLRKQHVVADFVYADTEQEAIDKMMACGGYLRVWCVDEDGVSIHAVKDPWNLPEDHPNYCPF